MQNAHLRLGILWWDCIFLFGILGSKTTSVPRFAAALCFFRSVSVQTRLLAAVRSTLPPPSLTPVRFLPQCSQQVDLYAGESCRKTPLENSTLPHDMYNNTTTLEVFC